MAGDVEEAYRQAPNQVRRQLNQVFFAKLLVYEDYGVDSVLAAPFDILLSSELREAAVRSAETDLRRAVDELLEKRAAKTNTSSTDEASSFDQGLKYETMVGEEGLEPSRPLATAF